MIMNSVVIRILVLAVLLISPTGIHASDETDVRDTVNRVFNQLKTHDYSSLYDALPSFSRSRMSRDRFVSSLERAQNIYSLDRIEVGVIKVTGNIALVDTVLYGSVTPIQAEGKILAQQYLVREEGKWRVATGDQATIKKFLAANPAFSKTFRVRSPRVYVKQNGKWVEFTPPNSNRRKT